MDCKLIQKGFTLIEVLVMTVLLAMAFLVFLGSLNLGRDLQNKSEIKSVQAVLLHDLQEQIKSRRFDENLTEPWSDNLGPDQTSNFVLDFDGSNDVVIIPDAPAFNFGTGPFSVAAWFKKEGQGRGDIINLKGSGGDFGFLLNSNETFGIYFNAWSITNGSPFTLNEWHHAVFVRDNSGNLKTYIDGQVDGSGYQSANFSSNQGDLRIGSNHNNGSLSLLHDGQIDEVAFWNKQLTNAEILSLYGNGSPIDARQNFENYSSGAFLTGYWRFDEGSGNTVNDLSGNGNNGTVNGALWIDTNGQNSYEINLSNFDDVDDFNNYQVTQYVDHPAFGAEVDVEYVNQISKFRVVSSTPTEYKRVIVKISHSSFSTLSDTLIIGAGL